MPIPNQPIQFHQYSQGQWNAQQGTATVETSVSLTVNGEVWMSFMCTPVNLEALAVGFLYNEGFIEARSEIADVRVCPQGDNVDVWLQHSVEKPTHWSRTSGCTGGVCGHHSQNPIALPHPAIPVSGETAMLTTFQVCNLMEELYARQEIYPQSGGVHMTGLSNREKLCIAAEDIGRNNTLDKIAGRCLLEDIQLEPRILLTTGRISFEMLQKSIRMGAKIVISRSAPSSSAMTLAQQQGITLVGYARRDSFNLYTYPQRILAEQR